MRHCIRAPVAAPFSEVKITTHSILCAACTGQRPVSIFLTLTSACSTNFRRPMFVTCSCYIMSRVLFIHRAAGITKDRFYHFSFYHSYLPDKAVPNPSELSVICSNDNPWVYVHARAPSFKQHTPNLLLDKNIQRLCKLKFSASPKGRFYKLLVCPFQQYTWRTVFKRRLILHHINLLKSLIVLFQHVQTVDAINKSAKTNDGALPITQWTQPAQNALQVVAHHEVSDM